MSGRANNKSPSRNRTPLVNHYAGEPSNTVSCAITDKRKEALRRHAVSLGTTTGSYVRECIEQCCGAELDAIEETL